MEVKEIWKSIPDAKQYQVSNLGRVKHVYKNSERFLKPMIRKSGYLDIHIRINKKDKYILLHRLVLSVFNPIENMESFEVNHKNENKSDCRLFNLEWMTSKENCNYGKRNEKISKNTSKSKKVMCIETGKIYSSIHAASKDTGIKAPSICVSCKRNEKGLEKRYNGHSDLHWRYI